MVCIEPLRDITKKEFKEGRYYSACGFSDWIIGRYAKFQLDVLGRPYSEIKHYLNTRLPICESGYYWVGEGECFYYHMVAYGENKYLDGSDKSYFATFADGPSNPFDKNCKEANAILIRKVK